MSGKMTGLKKIKTKQLLLVSFLLQLAFLLALGGFSLYTIQKQAGNTQSLYDRPHSNLVGMWEVKARIAQTGNALREGVLERKPMKAELAANFTGAYDELVRIEGNKVDPTQPMSENMKMILASIQAWGDKGREIARVLEEGRSVSASMITSYSELEQAAITNIDSIVVTAAENALKFRNTSLASAANTTIVAVVIFAAAIGVTLLLLNALIHFIMEPLGCLLTAAREIETGHLREPIAYHASNEFGELADCFRQMQTSLCSVIGDVTQNLNKMEEGDLQIEMTAEYPGDFGSIRDSLRAISNELNSVLSHINRSAGQVASGSEQVSGGAQALSQGATEQAASVQELAATIEEISNQIGRNAQSAGRANQQSMETAAELDKGKRQMGQMTEAMGEINGSSTQIGKIIKTIEDIAFQTNILALNAAVEAARAGAAGKGFAVVADEVRNLAGKSAEASKSTSELIEATLRAVRNGAVIADETAASLDRIVVSSKRATDLVEEIAAASQTQAASIAQVTQGINQISSVVQSNSATAEQSAAASEELSAQAQTLKELVSRFRLGGGSTGFDVEFASPKPAVQDAGTSLPLGKY